MPKMKIAGASLLLVISTIAIVTAGGTASAAEYPPEPAEGQLVVAPGFWCENPDPRFPCETDLNMGVGGGDSTETSIILERIGGGRVATNYGVFSGETLGISTPNQLLPSGRYRLRAKLSEAGRWSCSIYYEDGCIWLGGSIATHEWRFTYTAGTTLVRQPYTAPTTRLTLTKKRVTGKKKQRVRFKGVLRGRVERGDFTLSAETGLNQRIVTLQVKRSAEWRTLQRAVTTSAGRFNFQVPRRKKDRRYRITAAPASGSPGTTVTLRVR